MSVDDSAIASTSNIDGDDLPENNRDEFHNNNKDLSLDNQGRSSCKFGKQCYRQNPRHRVDLAHPGDIDFEVPDMPPPKTDAPKCEFGRKCYRLNPEHFKNFEHPRNINIQENYNKQFVKRNANKRNSDSDISDEEQDPFAGDSDGSDYIPSEDD